jgi:hypothetical protein
MKEYMGVLAKSCFDSILDTKKNKKEIDDKIIDFTKNRTSDRFLSVDVSPDGKDMSCFIYFRIIDDRFEVERAEYLD